MLIGIAPEPRVTRIPLLPRKWGYRKFDFTRDPSWAHHAGERIEKLQIDGPSPRRITTPFRFA
jgi:hypothetical protein